MKSLPRHSAMAETEAEHRSESVADASRRQRYHRTGRVAGAHVRHDDLGPRGDQAVTQRGCGLLTGEVEDLVDTGTTGHLGQARPSTGGVRRLVAGRAVGAIVHDQERVVRRPLVGDGDQGTEVHEYAAVAVEYYYTVRSVQGQPETDG